MNSTHRINCVVIDDNQDVIDVFWDLLKMSGVDVIAKGTDGMDAVKLYEKYRPDLIFVDLIMPKYDGFYAIKNIRDKSKCQDSCNHRKSHDGRV